MDYSRAQMKMDRSANTRNETSEGGASSPVPAPGAGPGDNSVPRPRVCMGTRLATDIISALCCWVATPQSYIYIAQLSTQHFPVASQHIAHSVVSLLALRVHKK